MNVGAEPQMFGMLGMAKDPRPASRRRLMVGGHKDWTAEKYNGILLSPEGYSSIVRW